MYKMHLKCNAFYIRHSSLPFAYKGLLAADRVS